MEENKIAIVERGLIIVDMINGFIKEGALADPTIKSIIGENVRLAKEFIMNEDPIIVFRDVHTPTSTEFESFPSHCLLGSDEIELIDELKELNDNLKIIDKNSTSGIFAPGFMDYINSMSQLSEVVITGCCTDICVLNLAIPLKNFFNQVNKSVEVIVPENAVATYHSNDVHDRNQYTEIAFQLMEQSGIKLVKRYGGKNGK